jgi:hypothetical protein
LGGFHTRPNISWTKIPENSKFIKLFQDCGFKKAVLAKKKRFRPLFRKPVPKPAPGTGGGPVRFIGVFRYFRGLPDSFS